MSTNGRLLGEVLADFVAERIGSWRFVAIQSTLIVAWIVLNVIGPWKPDIYPFILLNLLLSLQAAYTGPVLLISANRAASTDHRTLQHLNAALSHLAAEHKALHEEHRKMQADVTRLLGLLEHKRA